MNYLHGKKYIFKKKSNVFKTTRSCVNVTIIIVTFKQDQKWPFTYRKIPKISSGAYILQRPFLRGLFLEGLIFGGAYLRREICISKSTGLAL